MNAAERNALLQASDTELLGQCEVDAYRASGPGGQKRNKTSSAIRLRHRPTGLLVISEESRSQHENKAQAVRRLRLACALSIRAPLEDVAPIVTRIADYCDRNGRFRIGRKNEEFGRVAAEILDVIAAYRGHVRESAEALGLSSGQLARFLSIEPKVMVAVNQMRQAEGLKPLRSES